MSVGIHQSFYGLATAVTDAEYYGFDTFQIFTRNNRNLKGRTFMTDDYVAFNKRLTEAGITDYVIHAPYAMNPASGDPGILQRTIDLIRSDMYVLSNMIGNKHYVLHPGAYTDYSPEGAMATLIDTLHELANDYKGTKIAVELMAGQGTQIMCKLDQICWLLQSCCDIPEFELCLDTCHMYGAGLDPKHVLAAMNMFCGYERIGVIHVNGSKCAFGSYKDRHDNIGSGFLQETVLKRQVLELHEAAPNAPIILETPESNLLYDAAIVQSWLTSV